MKNIKNILISISVVAILLLSTTLVISADPSPPKNNVAPDTPMMVVGPLDALVGETVEFSTMTTDANGDDLTYIFDFGDGLGDIVGPLPQGELAIVSHEYNESGMYSVRVMASDQYIAESDWSPEFVIEITEPEPENTAPELYLPKGPTELTVGEVGTFVFKGIDPEDDDLYYALFWGDEDGDIYGPYESGYELRLKHIYSYPGNYKIFYYACDSKGALSKPSDVLMVTVIAEEDTNLPPNTPSKIKGETRCITDETYEYKTFVIDPDGDDMYVVFYWGDGTKDIVGPVSSATDVHINHIWTVDDVFEMSASAIDVNGLSSDYSEPNTVYVKPDPNGHEDTPPTTPIRPHGKTILDVDERIICSTVSYDADDDNLVYVFDWGDGTETTTWEYPQGRTAFADHRYDKPGMFGIKVYARNEFGKSHWSETLYVYVFEVPNNEAPTKPTRPIGETKCFVGEKHSYRTVSRDPDGDDITYLYKMGDGTKFAVGPERSGLMVTGDHVWKTAGKFFVTVIATDPNDHHSIESTPLIVTVVKPEETPNQRPAMPTITGPTEIPVGETVEYEVISIDPDGDKVFYEYYFYSSLGGGPYSEGICGPFEQFTLVTSWPYTGKNWLVIHAVDEHGLRSNGQTHIVEVTGSISPSIPYIWCNHGHDAETDQVLRFSFTSRDLDRDDLQYYIDWDDGHTETTDWVKYGDERVYLNHEYRHEGTYNVKAKSIDSNGMESDWSEEWDIVVDDDDDWNGRFPFLRLIYELLRSLLGFN